MPAIGEKTYYVAYAYRPYYISKSLEYYVWVSATMEWNVGAVFGVSASAGLLQSTFDIMAPRYNGLSI
jgi:hypothetical protein